MSDYHDLLVHKRAVEFVKLTYRFAMHFPTHEQYALTSQLRRAAVSVMANIVEGNSRKSSKDFYHFLVISSSSLDECQCYFELAHELGYVRADQSEYIVKKKQEVGFLLSRLMKAVSSKDTEVPEDANDTKGTKDTKNP